MNYDEELKKILGRRLRPPKKTLKSPQIIMKYLKFLLVFLAGFIWLYAVAYAFALPLNIPTINILSFLYGFWILFFPLFAFAILAYED